jgi:hypothetical protein
MVNDGCSQTMDAILHADRLIIVLVELGPKAIIHNFKLGPHKRILLPHTPDI